MYKQPPSSLSVTTVTVVTVATEETEHESSSTTPTAATRLTAEAAAATAPPTRLWPPPPPTTTTTEATTRPAVKWRLGDYEPGQSLFRHDYREISSAPLSRSIQSGSIAPPKLEALVYDILPSTTAVFSYAIGSRKLSVNEQFFCWCSNCSKFVTNNSNYLRDLFYNWPCRLRQLK